jgi:hypothetical protein
LVRSFAAVVLIACAAFWFARGAHTGWSQHQVPITGVDEVTGLEFVHYEDRYVPGVEWPIAGLLVAVGLFGASFLFRSNSNPPA